MTDKQLSEREERATTLVHPITQQSFCEIAAEHFASMTKRNPSSMARIKRVALRYPGLAQELLKHFPGDEELQDIKDGWWIGPPIPQMRGTTSAMFLHIARGLGVLIISSERHS